MEDKVVAIFCSDLHFSLTPPVFRSNENDWFAAMKRSLNELEKVQAKYGGVPIFCAGDIFDIWNSQPELINFLLQHLPPKFYCIPGQHDLPYHDYGSIARSAYWTLVSAGAVEHLDSPTTVTMDSFGKGKRGLCIHPFSFGQTIKPNTDDADSLHVCLAHQYVWTGGNSYLKAPPDAHVTNLGKCLKDYDIAVFGDNHISFETAVHTSATSSTLLFNCGSFMRRASDQIAYRPRIGLLTSGRQFITHRMNIKRDMCLVKIEASGLKSNDDINEFVKALEGLDSDDLDFVEVVKQYMKTKDVSQEVRVLIMRMMST